MEDDLHPKSLFLIEIGVNWPQNSKEFLQRSSKYMDYENEELARETLIKSSRMKEVQPKETRKKKDQGSSHRKPRGRGPRFTEHAPLYTTMAKILAKCANTELPKIKPSDPIPKKKWTDTKKYRRYHRSNGHDTNRAICEERRRSPAHAIT